MLVCGFLYRALWKAEGFSLVSYEAITWLHQVVSPVPCTVLFLRNFTFKSPTRMRRNGARTTLLHSCINQHWRLHAQVCDFSPSPPLPSHVFNLMWFLWCSSFRLLHRHTLTHACIFHHNICICMYTHSCVGLDALFNRVLESCHHLKVRRDLEDDGKRKNSDVDFPLPDEIVALPPLPVPCAAKTSEWGQPLLRGDCGPQTPPAALARTRTRAGRAPVRRLGTPPSWMNSIYQKRTPHWSREDLVCVVVALCGHPFRRYTFRSSLLWCSLS